MTAHLALKKQVEKFGGTLEDESSGHWRVFQCEAPEGKCWAATVYTHTLRVEWRKDDPEMRRQALVDALERVAYGLVDCECEECRGEENRPCI